VETDHHCQRPESPPGKVPSVAPSSAPRNGPAHPDPAAEPRRGRGTQGKATRGAARVGSASTGIAPRLVLRPLNRHVATASRSGRLRQIDTAHHKWCPADTENRPFHARSIARKSRVERNDCWSLRWR